jgi:hypothetical protein
MEKLTFAGGIKTSASWIKSLGVDCDTLSEASKLWGLT